MEHPEDTRRAPDADQPIGAIVCWSISRWLANRDLVRQFIEVCCSDAEAAVPKGTLVSCRELSTILTTLMQGTMKHLFLGGFPIRDGGGVYFVPRPMVESAMLLKSSIPELVGKFRLSVIEVGGLDRNLEQISTLAVAWHTERLKEICDESTQLADSLRATMKSPDERNIRVRLQRYDLASARIELYRGVLNVDAISTLLGEVNRARNDCENKLRGLMT